MTGIRAYPTGFGFTLSLRLRNIDRQDKPKLWPFPASVDRRRGEPLADGFLRLAIRFADGRNVINFNPPRSVPTTRTSIHRC